MGACKASKENPEKQIRGGPSGELTFCGVNLGILQEVEVALHRGDDLLEWPLHARVLGGEGGGGGLGEARYRGEIGRGVLRRKANRGCLSCLLRQLCGEVGLGLFRCRERGGWLVGEVVGREAVQDLRGFLFRGWVCRH